MSPHARIIRALHAAEALVAAGARGDFALRSAARRFGVERSYLCELWLAKLVECGRAREQLRAMRAHDEAVNNLGRV